MQGKRNQSIFSITDENDLKVMDIYDFPIILQRIFEKSPDQCYSISYLWRDIIKPFHLSIGFIGIEANGFYIIKALALFGHHVTFWDSPADSPKCNEAIENGAIWATSPAEVVSKCQVTFICVADDEEFSDIMEGQNGLLDGLKKCKIAKNIVQLSPISASCSRKHAEDIKTSGNRYLESPILGTRCNGENRLLLCCSGDKKAFQDLSDCLCGTGARAFFVSEETGAAYKYKDMFFAMKTLMILPLIESLNYSTSIGCDPNILTNILNICEGSENKLKNIQGQKEINLSVKDASKSFSNLNIYNPNFPLFSIKAISDALMVSKKNGHSMQDIGTLNVMEILERPKCVWKYTQVYK